MSVNYQLEPEQYTQLYVFFLLYSSHKISPASTCLCTAALHLGNFSPNKS